MATNPITDAAQRAQLSAQNTVTQFQDILAKKIATDEDINSLISRSAANSTVKTVANQAIIFAEQETARNIGQIFQSNVSDTNNAIREQAEIAKVASDQRNKIGNQIKEKLAINFFDKPYEYIASRLTLDQDTKLYSTAKQQEDDAYSRIQKLNALTDSSIVTNRNFTEKMNATIAQNELEAVQLAAEQAKLTYKNTAFGAQAELLSAINNATKTNFDIIAKSTDIRLQNEESARQKKLFQITVEKYELEKQGDELIGQTIARGLQVLNPDTAESDIKIPGRLRQYVALAKLPGEAGEYWRRVFAAGQTGLIADSPANLANSIKANVNIKFTDQTIKFIALDAANRAISSAIGAETKPTRQQLESNINTNAQTILNEQTGSIKSGDSQNIFALPFITDMVKSMKIAQQLPFIVSSVFPIAESNGKLDDSQFFKLAADSVTKDNNINQVASDISFIYRVAVEQNLASKQITKYGFDMPQDAKQYNVRIGSKLVDLTNEAAVKRALMLEVSSRYYNN